MVRRAAAANLKETIFYFMFASFLMKKAFDGLDVVEGEEEIWWFNVYLSLFLRRANAVDLTPFLDFNFEICARSFHLQRIL